MGAEDCVVINETTRQSEIEQSTCVLPETLKILTENQRYIFMVIFVIFSILSICGNCAAIYSIIQRKYRYIQKTCIISLAISDILSTIVIATNNLDSFSQELLLWNLGSFLCSVIPMLQMAGIMASSVALMFIAMDRYRNVVHALSKRWNPTRSSCLCVTTILWVVVLAISYPMYDFFNEADVTLVYFVSIEEINYVDAKVCISFSKNDIKIYYIIMVIIIFLPLLIVFIWFYYNIASLIWKHRKPISSNYNKNENSATLENSTTASEIRFKINKKHEKPRDFKVERKIRTFKIIVTLMLVFIICRLPYFTVYILKLSLTNDYGMWTWTLNYSFVALHIVNCCLNPLLYTFLNPTLTFWVRIKKSIKNFTWEICCFCFSKGEFDEFERENPFMVNKYNKTRESSKIKFKENTKNVKARF